MSPFAWRKRAIDDWSNSHANQTLNWITHRITHTTNLTIASFVNHYPQHTSLQLPHVCGRRNAIIQFDTISQFLQGRFADTVLTALNMR
jgi:hypothetical protein